MHSGNIVETLENRRMLTGMVGGILRVDGADELGNGVHIWRETDRIVVEERYISAPPGYDYLMVIWQQEFAAADITGIECFGGQLGDYITIDADVDLPATIHGGLGDDTIQTGGGDDVIYGGVGNDLIRAGDGNDAVYGRDGRDTIYGQGGDDSLEGNGKDDVIFGNTGSDTLVGGAGSDELHGGLGNDTLVADIQANLPELPFRNLLYGGAGSDHLWGANGDSLYGGTGPDVFLFHGSFATPVDYSPSSEGDRILGVL